MKTMRNLLFILPILSINYIFAADSVVKEMVFQEEAAIKSERLVKTIHELYDKVVITAKSSALTGSTDISDIHAVIQAFPDKEIENVYEHPAFSNVNTVRAYSDKLLDRKSASIANQIVWTQCVESLIAILEQVGQIPFSSESNKQAVLQDISTILQIGQEIIDFIERINGEEYLYKLIEECKTSLFRLQAIANAFFDTKFEESLKGEIIARINRIIDEDIAIFNSMPHVNFSELSAQVNTFWQIMGNHHNYSCVIDNTSVLNMNYHGSMFWYILATSGRAHEACPEMRELLTRQQNNVVGQRGREYAQFRASCIGQLQAIKVHRISLLSGQINDCNFGGALTSTLIYPSGNLASNQLILFDFNTISVDPAVIKAEFLGLGRTRCEYDISGGNFYLRIYFIHNDQKQLIKERYVPYDAINTSNEQIYNFFYGGRYCKMQDRISLHWRQSGAELQAACGIPLMLYPPMNPYAPACNTLYQLFDAPQSAEFSMAITGHINARLHKKRLEANELFLHEAESPAESDTTRSLSQLDLNYKMLEASAALGYQDFMTTPACLLFKNRDLLKNRAAIIAYLKRYATSDAHSDYLPVAPTIDALETTKHALIQHRPELQQLRQLILHLNLALHTTREISVSRPISSTEFLYGQIKELRERQHELEGSVFTMRSEMNVNFGQIKALLERR